MPPVVIDVRTSDDPRDVVHRAVQALAEGKVVAFPTETVYGVAASAFQEEAVERLTSIKGRSPNQPLALAVKSDDEALDYVPDMPVLGRRLARRCWPGPVTLVFDCHHPDSLVRQLPESVCRWVVPQGTIGLRVPAHPLILDVLRLLAGPLVLTSANRSGAREAVTGEEVVAELGDDVALVLDDGRCQFGQASSVVLVRGDQLTMLREGVVSESTLRWLASFMVLIVCTGNTCRSPMAELLLRKRVADRLGCTVNEIEEHGVIITSAGIAAMAGGRPTPEAVQVMAARGLDLSAHESQPLTDRLVRQADVILTMTRSHREAVAVQWPDAAGRTQMFARNGADIADPIGGPPELYEQCADQLDAQLDALIAEWDTLLPRRPAG